MELSPSLAARSPRAARLWLSIGPAALLAGLGALAVVLTSDHDDSKALTIALILPVGWAFVAAGLVAWAREPANRIGGLLVLAGFAWLFAALADADTPIVFAFGELVFPLAYAVIVHLLLAYPTGRLTSRSDAAVAALAYLDATVLRLPWLLLQRLPSDSCPDCPTNPVLVSDRPGLADAVDGLTSVVGVAIVAYVFIVLARRWRSATPRARRVLEPVLASGGSVLLGLAALLVVDLVSPRAADVLQWLVFALLITVPASFLVGLLRTRLATAGASRLLLETPTTPTPEEAQAGLRRALGDPTLALAYWLPERGVYVDTDGSEVELPPDGDGRMTTLIDYDGRPVAALVHDESLRREQELVDAVVAAARLAIEKDRLQAEVRSRLDELERERDFIRTVVDSAPAFFCVVDLNGTVMRFNETGARMTGRLDDEDVRGRPFWEVFVAPEDAATVRERLLAAAAGDGSSEVETELVAASGERLVLAWSSTPLVDAQGRPRLLVSGTDVTQRKRQAEELRRERDFSHAVTDTTPSFLVIVDDEGRIAPGGVNKACEDAVGRTESELVGERFVRVFIPPAEHGPVVEKLAEAASGALVEHEGPWLSRDGNELWVAWSCRPLHGGGARRTFLVCGADLTERRRHERELQLERDALNTIADTAPSFILVVDDSGRFSRQGLNVPAERALGYTHAEAASRDFVELLVAPEDQVRAREHFERSVTSREPTELDSSWLTSSGERRRVAWSARWLSPDEDGVRSWFLVCGNDITERELQAQALERERDFLVTIGDATPSWLVVVHSSGRLIHEALNDAAGRALGYTDAETDGQDFVGLLVAPEHAAAARARLAQAAAEGEAPQLDSYWLTRDGERRLVAWSGTRLGPADDGRGTLVLVCGTDVTERKRQEEELRASRARIVEAADLERRRLERNLHDGAQQRLVTLSLTLRLVESRLGRDSDTARLLAGARDELAHALEELRDLARGLHPAVLSDHGLSAALDALAARIPGQVRIHTQVEGRLPEPVEVAAYYVVSEALTNVQKYAHATRVAISVARAEGQAVVEVRDDGVGGAVAVTGSGLRGLADRVEALGGTLEVESPVGAGTTVRAVIPTA